MSFTNNLGFGKTRDPRSINYIPPIPLNDPILTNPNIPFVRNTTLDPQPTNNVPLRPLPPLIGFLGNWGL